MVLLDFLARVALVTHTLYRIRIGGKHVPPSSPPPHRPIAASRRSSPLRHLMLV